MKGDLAKNLALILGAVFLGVLGQLSMKHGMGQVVIRTTGIVDLVSSLARALIQPFVTAGLGLYAVSALVWLLVLSRVELSFAYPMISVGGQGVISVVSNVAPKEMCGLVSLALDGKTEEARKQHYVLWDLFKDMFIETNPIPVKAALEMMGLINGKLRLPLSPIGDAGREQVRKTLSSLGLV